MILSASPGYHECTRIVLCAVVVLAGRLLWPMSQKVSGFVVPMVYSLRDIHQRGLDAVLKLSREGKLAIPIGGKFPLAEAVEAVRFPQSRRSTGKLLLIP